MTESCMSADHRSRLCRDLAVLLTERPSVTGTADEASFGPWLAAVLTQRSEFGTDAEVWMFPVAQGDPRHVVAMLVRGGGSRTVVLTGHYDTVTVADYGALASVATMPDALIAALSERLSTARSGSVEALAREDLKTGNYLPGRGVLDMKGGLAAGLAAIAALRSNPQFRHGNLLFLAVPDEENASAGARAAAVHLADIALNHDLEIAAVINLDAIADVGDGSDGRVVALGTVGKVLATAFVVGVPVHSGFPLRGINAAVLAAAIVQRLEWAPELTDNSAATAGTPVSLLSLRDGKTGYDVTTPGTAFATWSVLNHRREPAVVLDLVETLAREAISDCIASLRARADSYGNVNAVIAKDPEVPFLRYVTLLDEVRIRHPAIDHEIETLARKLHAGAMSLPDQCHALTADLWTRSGRSGPAVVFGFGSIPYLATHLGDPDLKAVVDAFVVDAKARHGVEIKAAEYFAGISDMSFFGESHAEAFAELARNTPCWPVAVGLTASSVAQIPTLNLGPWGRDYHTSLERIEMDYGFRVLPGLLCDLVSRILNLAVASRTIAR